ncbi:MAG: ADOP family duplicated permease, partial [Gemmatimonadota bacterium]
MGSPRPPRLAERLLALCLPRGGVRATVLGDLHELHAARVADPSVGRARAALWYWSHAIRIGARYAVRRARRSWHPRLDPESPGAESGGSVVEARGGVFQDFVRDARMSLRGFRRAPGFVAVAVVTLALGVGASTAVFSVVNGLYLRPLDFGDPDRLVLVGRSAEDGTYRMATQTAGTWSDWARGQTVFRDFAGYRYWTTTLERDGVASRVDAVHSLGSIFDVLGVRPILGRTFTAAEEGPGREDLAVLSHAFWQREFAGEDPVGRTLVLDGVPHEVIGVMPPTFRFPDASTDLWKTADLSADAMLDRDDQFVNTVARLAPGRTFDDAVEAMRRLHAELRADHPDRLAGSTVELVPLRDALVGDVGPLWLTLMATVGFVLLIACVNVANLQLSRIHARSGELSLRRALGASRGRVARQVITESVVLAALGGIAGLGAGWLFLRGMLAWIPGGIRPAVTIGMDGAVLAFTLAVSAAAGILSGALPALRLPETGLGSRIRARRGGRSGHRLRHGLLVAETALAVVLVAGAGLAVRGFAAVSALDPGFDPTGRSVFRVELRGGVPDADRATFYGSLGRRVAELPAVRAAGVTSVYPMAGFTPGSFVAGPGEAVAAGDGTPSVRYVGVTPSFRAAAGIPLLSGRDLDAGDGRAGAPAILLSRSAADLLFPDGAALGRRVYLGPDGVVAPVSTVVGIVGDVRQQGMTEPAPPMAYVPRGNITFWRGFHLVVDAPGAAAGPALLADVRRIARGLDARAVVFRPIDARTFVSEAMSGQRNLMLLFTLIGGVALALAIVGVFGVVAFLVGRRTREMSIRVAVGAARSEIQGMVVRQSLGPVAIGAVAGTLAAAG